MERTGDARGVVLRAGGVALLLPVALVVGVLATATLGGGHALRSFDQVFSGPRAPGADAAGGAPGLESARVVPAIPARRRRSSSASRRATAPARRATGGGGATEPSRTPAAHAPSSRPVPRPPSHRSPAAPASPAPAAPAPSGSGSGSTTAPPAPAPSPVHAAGQQVADTAAALPGPAGQAAGGAVQTVVDLLP